MGNNKLGFWEEYSNRKDLSMNSLMNLEVNEELSKRKFEVETKMFDNLISLNPNYNVLDLGGGIGLWANFFSQKGCNVTLVEKEKNFIEIAKKIAKKNITIHHSDVVDFSAEENSFDVVFISGVTIYLDDRSLLNLMSNIKKYLKSNGFFLHRDAYGVKDDFIITNKYSENLNLNYSAKYRSRVNYDKFFVDKFGFTKILDEDFYPKGSIHNNRRETKLRFAIYKNK